jgi:hypothetical protein
MLVFYNVYFRSHYYFRSYCFVKRKTRICAIGSGARRPNIGRGLLPGVSTPSHPDYLRCWLREGAARDP